MLLAEQLGTLDDLIGGLQAPCVHVAGGEFLSEARRSARVQGVDHVSESGVHMHGITHLQRTVRRGSTAIVINDHRIFLIRIEMRR